MSRPTRVQCCSCRETISASQAYEVAILLTRHAGGSLGDVRHLTPVNVWFCKDCGTSSPFGHTVRAHLAEELHRPAATRQAGLGLGGAS